MRSFKLCLIITSIAVATFRQILRYRRVWRKKAGIQRFKRMLFIRTNTKMCFVLIVFLWTFYVFGSCFFLFNLFVVFDFFLFSSFFFKFFSSSIFNKSLLRVSPLSSVMHLCKLIENMLISHSLLIQVFLLP